MADVMKVTDNRIILTKADGGLIPLEITNSDGSEFTMDGVSEILFSVRTAPKGVEGSELKIQKNIQPDNIELTAADTENMDYGSYIFDIQVAFNDGRPTPQTILKGQFVITAEVS